MIRAFLVRGHSMAPRVPDGALVLVRSLPGPPAPGAVVVYRHRTRGFPVVHRVQAAGPGGWRLQGDANLAPDPLAVDREAMLGRVWLVLPRLGRLLTFFRQEKLP